MSHPIFHSQYTAAQIEAAIGKGPRVNSGYWEIWNIAAGAYESTGVAAGVNPPSVVTLVSQMVNRAQVYIYVGTETGYTSGDWYYWDGSAWTSGGTFLSPGSVPDTRTINGKPLSDDITLTKADLGLSNVENVLQYSFNNKPSAFNVTFNDSGLGGYQAANVQAAINTVFATSQRFIDRGEISFPLSWSGSGPFTQTVTVISYMDRAVRSSDIISLQPTVTQVEQLMSDGVAALMIENNYGTLTAYALGAAPTTAMTIACTIEEDDAN